MHLELAKLILIDDDAAIRVLNQHATDVSSRYKKVSEAYEESFESFLVVNVPSPPEPLFGV
jgi:hypothetical protein